MSKIIRKIIISFFSIFIATIIIYWFNLENKLIYYVIHPTLNKIYNKQRRDVKI